MVSKWRFESETREMCRDGTVLILARPCGTLGRANSSSDKNRPWTRHGRAKNVLDEDSWFFLNSGLTSYESETVPIIK